MSNSADAAAGLGVDQTDSLSQDAFKRQLHQQLLGTGVLGNVKSHLRAQLLAQLQKRQVVQLSSEQAPLKLRALNSLIQGYLGAAPYPYALSVFCEEASTAGQPLLSEAEVMDVLRVDKGSLLYQAYIQAKQGKGCNDAPQGSCPLTWLIEALAEVGKAGRGLESSTQTAGGDKYHLELKLQQLEHEYQAKLRAQTTPAGLEEKMAVYRQQIEEQAKADVARQVERIREVEVAGVRLEEAAKWRRALEGERQELERLHSERLVKLRAREEELAEKLRRQQRELETAAFDHRQRLLREEERLRTWKHEAQGLLDAREEQLKHVSKQLELREKAISARESAAEGKASEAAQVMSTAHVKARAEVEKEYLELKAALSTERLQLELDRARLVELRNEAAAEMAGGRAKEDRLRVLESARAEAEARAAAHAAESEILRLQVERLHMELASARDEVSRKVSQAADNADAMLSNAAGALGMLEKEAVHQRGAVAKLRAVEIQLEEARAESAREQAVRVAAESARDDARERAQALAGQVKELSQRLHQMGDLVEEALAARDASVREAEEAQWAVAQLQHELAETKSALSQLRQDAIALRAQAAGLTPGGGAAGGALPTMAASRGATPLTALAGGLRGGGSLTPYAGGGGGSRGVVGAGGVRESLEQSAARVAGANATLAALRRSQEAAASWLGPSGGAAGGRSQVLVVTHPPSSAGLQVPSLATQQPISTATGNTPVRERLKRLTDAEATLATEMSSFRRRMAEQREASVRELQLVMTRVALSSPASSRTSMAGDLGTLDSPTLSRSPSRQGRQSPTLLSPRQSTMAPAAATGMGVRATSGAQLAVPPATLTAWLQAPNDTVATSGVQVADSAAWGPQGPAGQGVGRTSDVQADRAPVVVGRHTGSQGGFRSLQTDSAGRPPVMTAGNPQNAGTIGSLLGTGVQGAPESAVDTQHGSLSFSDINDPLQIHASATQQLVLQQQQQTIVMQARGGLPPLPAVGLPPLPGAPPASGPAHSGPEAVPAVVPVAASSGASIGSATVTPAVTDSVAPPPGLVLVSELQASSTSDAKGSIAGSEAAEAEQSGTEGGGVSSATSRRALVVSSSLNDVREAQAAKLRLLQEQQEARLAAQRAEQEQQLREESEAAEGLRASIAQSPAAGDSETYEEDFSDSASVRSSLGSTGHPAFTSQVRHARPSASSTTSSGSANSRQRTGASVVEVARAVRYGRRASLELEDHGVGSGEDSDGGVMQLETAGHHEREHSSRYAGGSASGSSRAGLGGVHSSTDSLPSHLGDLAVSVGEDSGIEVGLDDEDSGLPLGGTALGGSSDSVF